MTWPVFLFTGRKANGNWPVFLFTGRKANGNWLVFLYRNHGLVYNPDQIHEPV